jgi:hypothetical protein
MHLHKVKKTCVTGDVTALMHASKYYIVILLLLVEKNITRCVEVKPEICFCLNVNAKGRKMLRHPLAPCTDAVGIYHDISILDSYFPSSVRFKSLPFSDTKTIFIFSTIFEFPFATTASSKQGDALCDENATKATNSLCVFFVQKPATEVRNLLSVFLFLVILKSSLNERRLMEIRFIKNKTLAKRIEKKVAGKKVLNLNKLKRIWIQSWKDLSNGVLS